MSARDFRRIAWELARHTPNPAARQKDLGSDWYAGQVARGNAVNSQSSARAASRTSGSTVIGLEWPVAASAGPMVRPGRCCRRADPGTDPTAARHSRPQPAHCRVMVATCATWETFSGSAQADFGGVASRRPVDAGVRAQMEVREDLGRMAARSYMRRLRTCGRDQERGRWGWDFRAAKLTADSFVQIDHDHIRPYTSHGLTITRNTRYVDVNTLPSLASTCRTSTPRWQNERRVRRRISTSVSVSGDSPGDASREAQEVAVRRLCGPDVVLYVDWGISGRSAENGPTTCA